MQTHGQKIEPLSYGVGALSVLPNCIMHPCLDPYKRKSHKYMEAGFCN